MLNQSYNYNYRPFTCLIIIMKLPVIWNKHLYELQALCCMTDNLWWQLRSHLHRTKIIMQMLPEIHLEGTYL